MDHAEVIVQAWKFVAEQNIGEEEVPKDSPGLVIVDECSILAYKAEEAGRKVVKVNPHNTSQQCSNCGKLVKKGLLVRTHKCICGLTLDRDINAAINILKKAQGLDGAIVDSHALVV